MNKAVLLLSTLILLAIAGCGGSGETISVSLKCDSDCNESNAVVVKIYQLKNADKFSHSSFESLLRNPDEVLGDDLISGAKFEKLMAPDESFPIDKYEINKDAAYIGIVADFHTPAQDGWFQVIPVKDIGDLVVKIHANSLSVEKE
ncbi:MAG TPA: type VI secretion system lipoprotein TssJ [Ignavibacteriaceae bacterium]